MKRALVTGSTKGIGRAIGMKLLSQGCEVAFNYAADEESARQLALELDSLGYQGRYQIVRADMSRLQGINTLLSALDEKFERLDYLVLNAGTTWRGTLCELRSEQWEQVLNTNLTVPLFLIQTCASRMVEGGSILLIGSVLGQLPHATSLPYGTSKAAVCYLAKGLVKEFEAQKVRVNCLCPGFVETPWQRSKPAQIRRSIEDKVALHRFADPEEIAHMAASILENPYMNGSVVDVDGGYCYQ